MSEYAVAESDTPFPASEASDLGKGVGGLGRRKHMIDSKERDADPKEKRAKEAEKARREEQASIVQGLQTVLEGEEQLLAFARGRIAGGWRGKLTVGPEAFFAPFVNIALTERRFLLQHIHPENGRPSEILPHFFPIAEIQELTFTDIETFGGEPACRLILRLND